MYVYVLLHVHVCTCTCMQLQLLKMDTVGSEENREVSSFLFSGGEFMFFVYFRPCKCVKIHVCIIIYSTCTYVHTLYTHVWQVHVVYGHTCIYICTCISIRMYIYMYGRYVHVVHGHTCMYMSITVACV